jgi:hypothetical protein
MYQFTALDLKDIVRRYIAIRCRHVRNCHKQSQPRTLRYHGISGKRKPENAPRGDSALAAITEKSDQARFRLRYYLFEQRGDDLSDNTKSNYAFPGYSIEIITKFDLLVSSVMMSCGRGAIYRKSERLEISLLSTDVAQITCYAGYPVFMRYVKTERRT